MNKLLLIICLFLSACTKPIYIASGCPKPKAVIEPSYPIHTLKLGDPPAKVAKAVVMTIKMQQDVIKEYKIRNGEN